MITHVVAVLSIVSHISGTGWVKVANFYHHSPTSDLLSSFDKEGDDLCVLLVDTMGSEVRLPIRDVGYYETSQTWIQLNETMYFGRLSFFVRNYENKEIEHDVLRFEENMTIGSDHRSLMTLVGDTQTFSGYMCNMGRPLSVKKTAVFLCLHDVVERGIDTSLIVVVARPTNCKACSVYQLRPRKRESSLEFTLPESQTTVWNLSIEYRISVNEHTKLCQFIKKLVVGDLHMVVMKPNNTVLTKFECVVFTEKIYYESLGMWVPIISGLTCVFIITLTSFIVYKKCDRSCLRQLMPTPDQDTAPYRSFNSSNPSDSPVFHYSPHNNSSDTARYIRMKSLPGGATGDEEQEIIECVLTPTHIPSFLSRSKEPQYARI